MDQFLQRMQHIDRRWIYLVFSLVIIASLILARPTTPIVMPPVQSLYDAVEAAPAEEGSGKIITLGMTFSGGTMGENANQARAIIRHLMLRKKKFAIISIKEPQGAEYSKMIVSDIAKQYGYEYGKDWISFGYTIGSIPIYRGLTNDISSIIKKDGMYGKPLSTYPMMHGIESVKNNVSMHIEITASASVLDWIQVVQPATKPRLTLGYACTGIMVSEAYPYLDSGQLVGMLPGLKGAADYERLVDELEQQEIAAGHVKHPFDYHAPATLPLPKPARVLMFTQSTAHIVIIIFILIGNIGLLLSRYRRNKSESV